MVGVDIQAHGQVTFGCRVVGGDGAQGFSQHHADTAMQQAKRLLGAVVHRHAAYQVVIAHLGDFNAQMLDRCVGVASVDVGQLRGFEPDRHVGVLQSNKAT